MFREVIAVCFQSKRSHGHHWMGCILGQLALWLGSHRHGSSCCELAQGSQDHPASVGLEAQLLRGCCVGLLTSQSECSQKASTLATAIVSSSGKDLLSVQMFLANDALASRQAIHRQKQADHGTLQPVPATPYRHIGCFHLALELFSCFVL